MRRPAPIGGGSEEVLPIQYSPASAASARQQRADARQARQGQQQEAQKKRRRAGKNNIPTLPISLQVTAVPTNAETEYERKRLNNMARNSAFIADLMRVSDEQS